MTNDVAPLTIEHTAEPEAGLGQRRRDLGILA